jgi:V-type H+-transporting ATPase subunit a
VEGWMLADAAREVIMDLRTLSQGTMPLAITEISQLPAGTSPPTYFETNKFTSVFQGIVDTYGVGRYQEANPALFAAMTFPFLFGVMYGDIGHGFFLFVGSLLMVVYEKRIMKSGKMGEITGMVFGGRYMLLLMGAFAIYMGFIYNDIFSLTLPTFGTSWKVQSNFSYMTHVQPFGLDPQWHNAKNSLTFQNSMKMKMSVILGITQMLFGVCLKTSNAIYFRKPLDLVFECLPMIVFATCLFGYMVFLIFYKWSIDWNNGVDGMYGPVGGVPGTGYNPPALINTMISMALSPGYVKDPLYGRVVFPTKEGWPSNYTICGDPAILCCQANGCGYVVSPNV